MHDSSSVSADCGDASSAAPLRMRYPTISGQLLRFLAFLLLFTNGARLANALEFREARWGFNGTVKRNTFNLCSIDLFNPSPDPYQGTVQLKPTGGIGRGDETPWMDHGVYIGAGETRTIQFMPYITSQMLDWEVSWGPGGAERFEFPHSSREVAVPVAVQFYAAQSASKPLTGIEAFPESDFPIGAAGTEVLGSVVLDHVPRWDEVRRRAFRDWLGRGGHLYLINDRDGKRLEFPALLEELNGPSGRFMVGQGVVTRHGIVQNAGQVPGLTTEVAQSTIAPNFEIANQSFGNDPATMAMTQLFRTMRSMVRPDHNWTLIFILAFIYLLVLFPGIWLVSRKRGDFRATYALILGTVVLFSWFYAEVGKRGYDESTGLRELMVAYPLGNQRVALRKCGNLFVTSGGGYVIPTHGEGAVFSLESGAEFSGNAMIMNRPQAGVMADIPPFSACAFQESSVLPTTGDYSIQLKTLELNPTIQKIEVQLGAGIPSSSQVYLLSSGFVWTLTSQGTTWVNLSPAQPLHDVFQAQPDHGWSRLKEDQLKLNLVSYLVQLATSAEVGVNYGQMSTPVDASTVQVPAFTEGQILVYTAAPPEFLPNEYNASGQVLFVSKVDSSMATAAAP